MKFWQKIFLCSLILFTLAFDAGAYILVTASYKENLKREVNNSVREEAVIASSIQSGIANMEDLLDDSSNYEGVFYTLVQSLAEYYEDQMVTLQLYQNDTIIYSNLADSTEKWESLLGEKEQLVESRKENGKQYMYVVSKVPSYRDLTLVYARDISEVDVSRRESLRVFMMVSAGVVLLFSSIIFLMLKRLTKPIYELIGTTSKIADGDYQERVEIHRKDEFGELGRVFNQMANAVEENINELTEQSANKQIFIDDLAHEMKTPMTSILGYSSLLQNANLSEEQRERAIEYIHSSAERLSLLSEKLLELANLTADKVEKEQIAVVQLLQELEVQIGFSLEKRDLRLVTKGVLEHLTGDKTLLLSMLCNLVENAARACEAGKTITVQIYEEETPIIEVQDEGCGMPREEVEKVMLPFYKLDKARTRENGGAGLGLSIVKSIVQAHHAEIQIESEVGVGTKVRIIFPMDRKEA